MGIPIHTGNDAQRVLQLIEKARTTSRELQFAEAAALSTTAYELGLNDLGPTHYATISARVSLNSYTLTQGRLLDTTETLKLAATHLGDSNPITLRAAGNTVRELESLQKFSDAEGLARYILEVSKTTQGTRQAGSPQAMVTLAEILYQQRKLPESVRLYQKAVTICARENGPDSSSTGPILVGLARALAASKKFDQALAASRRALDLTPNQNLATLINAKQGYAMVLYACGGYAGSAMVNEELYELLVRHHVNHHPCFLSMVVSYVQALLIAHRSEAALTVAVTALKNSVEWEVDRLARQATILLVLGEVLLSYDGRQAQGLRVMEAALAMKRSAREKSDRDLRWDEARLATAVRRCQTATGHSPIEPALRLFDNITDDRDWYTVSPQITHSLCFFKTTSETDSCRVEREVHLKFRPLPNLADEFVGGENIQLARLPYIGQWALEIRPTDSPDHYEGLTWEISPKLYPTLRFELDFGVWTFPQLEETIKPFRFIQSVKAKVGTTKATDDEIDRYGEYFENIDSSTCGLPLTEIIQALERLETIPLGSCSPLWQLSNPETQQARRSTSRDSGIEVPSSKQFPKLSAPELNAAYRVSHDFAVDMAAQLCPDRWLQRPTVRHRAGKAAAKLAAMRSAAYVVLETWEEKDPPQSLTVLRDTF